MSQLARRLIQDFLSLSHIATLAVEQLHLYEIGAFFLADMRHIITPVATYPRAVAAQ